MYLRQWLDTWLSLYLEPRGLSPHTVEQYRRSVAAVPAELAAVDLVNLSPLDLRRWQVDRQRETPRAAQLDRIMITQAMRTARKLGLWSFVLDDDTLPKIRHKAAKAEILQPDQLAAYMAAAPKLASDAAPLLLLCASGVRRSEALGAKWADLDPGTQSLYIHGQRYRLPGSYEVHPPKTSAAVRRIALADSVFRCCYHRRPALGGWIVDITPELLAARHAAVIRAAGLPSVTLHGLRHSFAAAAAAVQPVVVVQHYLGHSTVKLTADLYAAHLPPVCSCSFGFSA
jgi:integrase